MTLEFSTILSNREGTKSTYCCTTPCRKNYVLHDVAKGIEENHRIALMVMLIDERPEEVTDFKRTVDAGNLCFL